MHRSPKASLSRTRRETGPRSMTNPMGRGVMGRSAGMITPDSRSERQESAHERLIVVVVRSGTHPRIRVSSSSANEAGEVGFKIPDRAAASRQSGLVSSIVHIEPGTLVSGSAMWR
jgi:hypothetical protein